MRVNLATRAAKGRRVDPRLLRGLLDRGILTALAKLPPPSQVLPGEVDIRPATVAGSVGQVRKNEVEEPRRDLAPCVVLRPHRETKRDAEPFRKPPSPRLRKGLVLLHAHVD